ncbi:MAG: hypothetical protein ACI9C1_004003 [Candidatus Aldehydirespiratoraceae bacterium]|jgi:hypothetical protein
MTMSELNLLMAEREIGRRLLDYCLGIDRCDPVLTASVYHDDGTDDHGSFVGLGKDFAVYAAESLAAKYEATQHSIGNPAIDFLDRVSALVTTYVHAEHVVVRDAVDNAGERSLITFEGEYRDRFELRDGAWRIATRVVIHSWDSERPLERAFDPDRFTQRERG